MKTSLKLHTERGFSLRVLGEGCYSSIWEIMSDNAFPNMPASFREALSVLKTADLIIGIIYNDIIIGSIILFKDRYSNDNYQMADIVVDKKYRKKWLTKKILKQFLEIINDYDIDSIYADTYSNDGEVFVNRIGAIFISDVNLYRIDKFSLEKIITP